MRTPPLCAALSCLVALAALAGDTSAATGAPSPAVVGVATTRHASVHASAAAKHAPAVLSQAFEQAPPSAVGWRTLSFRVMPAESQAALHALPALDASPPLRRASDTTSDTPQVPATGNLPVLGAGVTSRGLELKVTGNVKLEVVAPNLGRRDGRGSGTDTGVPSPSGAGDYSGSGAWAYLTSWIVDWLVRLGYLPGNVPPPPSPPPPPGPPPATTPPTPRPTIIVPPPTPGPPPATAPPTPWPTIIVPPPPKPTVTSTPVPTATEPPPATTVPASTTKPAPSPPATTTPPATTRPPVPPPTTAPPAPGDISTILAFHNRLRATHHAPPLAWSTSLASTSQAWADGCVFQHSRNGNGENLCQGHSDWGACMTAWADEEALYNYASPGFSSATGHFTQQVWIGSASIGCGKAACGGSTLYVCQYSPPGNVLGQFEANVKAP